MSSAWLARRALAAAYAGEMLSITYRAVGPWRIETDLQRVTVTDTRDGTRRSAGVCMHPSGNGRCVGQRWLGGSVPKYVDQAARKLVRELNPVELSDGPWRVHVHAANPLHLEVQLLDVRTRKTWRGPVSGFPDGWRCASIDDWPVSNTAKALARRAINQMPLLLIQRSGR